jgi:hypothetical protein
MSGWYWMMVYTRDPAVQLRGLYDYSAVNFGDAILLPVLSTVIARAYHRHTEMFQDTSLQIKERALDVYSGKQWTILTVLSATLYVAVFHFQGMYGQSRNWTYPEYGRTNAAGIWHSGFMFWQLYLMLGFYIRQILTLYLGTTYSSVLGEKHNLWLETIQDIVLFVVLLGSFSGLNASDRLATDASMLTAIQTLFKEPAVLGTWLFGIPLYLVAIMVVAQHMRVPMRWWRVCVGLLLIGIAPFLAMLWDMT